MSPSELKYSSSKTKPGKTKAFFICVLIASFLWLVHSLNTVYNYTINLPVTFKNPPQNKKSLISLPKQLSVGVKASGLKLCLILLNRPFEPLEIDFNALKSANNGQNYVLSSSEINFTQSFKFGAQIKHLNPDTLYFSEKTGYQKTVAIKAPLFLKCRQGFGYQQPVLTPSFTTIWGDTELVKNIDTIYTQGLNLSDVDQPVTVNMSIIKPGKEVYTAISEATLTIGVERLIEQTIVIPIFPLFKQSEKQVNMYPSKVKLKFTCLQNSFDLKDTVLFRVIVNCDKINPLTKKYPVFLSASPNNVTVMLVEPKEVEILMLKK